MILCIHLSAPFIKKENCKLGNKCAFKLTEKAGGESKKRTNSVAVAKNIGYDGVSGILVQAILQNMGEEVATKFRPSRVAQRFDQERDKKSHTLGVVQQRGQHGRSPNALSYEQLGSCAELIAANMKRARKKAWDVHKNVYKVKRTQACENSFRPPNRTTQGKVVAPRSGCNNKSLEFGASFHLMRKNELTIFSKKKKRFHQKIKTPST